MLISFFLLIIIAISLTVRGQPSPRFHVEAWLPFRNCEIDYYATDKKVKYLRRTFEGGCWKNLKIPATS